MIESIELESNWRAPLSRLKSIDTVHVSRCIVLQPASIIHAASALSLSFTARYACLIATSAQSAAENAAPTQEDDSLICSRLLEATAKQSIAANINNNSCSCDKHLRTSYSSSATATTTTTTQYTLAATHSTTIVAIHSPTIQHRCITITNTHRRHTTLARSKTTTRTGPLTSIHRTTTRYTIQCHIEFCNRHTVAIGIRST